ncbi:hypothetical protein [Mycoplasmopsis columboralis]|uniref:Uncharacterized protein n=1 Tax=Mycoplasmopsis columboralis TaxID=171282 RepID=A0A449B6S1_9BACT|nr:hypothetical protein [Mycoplasmopsis columboralis]VEU76307.1 Uncharacterised protein [Mycoplasmopsis columboralis]
MKEFTLISNAKKLKLLSKSIFWTIIVEFIFEVIFVIALIVFALSIAQNKDETLLNPAKKIFSIVGLVFSTIILVIILGLSILLLKPYQHLKENASQEVKEKNNFILSRPAWMLSAFTATNLVFKIVLFIFPVSYVPIVLLIFTIFILVYSLKAIRFANQVIEFENSKEQNYSEIQN